MGTTGGTVRVVPWSRLCDQSEILCALNTDDNRPTSAWVTIDDRLHRVGEPMTCLYSTDASQIGNRIAVEARNGKAVWLSVPAAGFVLYE